jgi:hypothetical protein
MAGNVPRPQFGDVSVGIRYVTGFAVGLLEVLFLYFDSMAPWAVNGRGVVGLVSRCFVDLSDTLGIAP